LTVLALVNGLVAPRRGVLEQLHDKASGFGLVRFDKPNRKVIVESWPLLADVAKPDEQFPGWPVTIDQRENYGRKAAALLPRLNIGGVENPLVEVIDEAGEMVYALRIAGSSFQPHVFAAGKYTVRIGDPEADRWKELTGLTATPGNEQAIDVRI
jgi:hypothetical protein